MDVENQVEYDEHGGCDGAKPNDIPTTVKPKVLAISVKVPWRWSVGKHVEFPFAPVHARHVRISFAGGISFCPMSFLSHGFE